MKTSRRTDLLLLLGMAAGIAVAGLGLLGESASPGGPLPVDAVASVGGRPISRDALDAAVALVERDRQRPCDAAEKAALLQRLIDEELLLQQGLELGLARSDRKLRADLVSAVVDAATAHAPAAEPSDRELESLLAENSGLFVPPPSMRLAQVFVSSGVRGDGDAAALAEEARRRLRAGEDPAAVRRELGDPPAVEIPSSLQPANRLRDYVGPSAAAAVLALGEGEVSEVLRGADGHRVLVVLERKEAAPANLDDRRGEVLAEYRRRQGERALAGYLDELRSGREVILAPEFQAALP